ncbi:hypothetical protein CROQUDRAFT_663990 [Cronartium quercuum f. sp. fusiforme G11]|uniref:NEDD8-activating enzyme E1 regulatory subunit n=1 Tax=Cronartium quercuum f. sp. fusiforme G11 TaxID=708437 RepID=A0A9P6T7A9_9BASI|nr:hypothetical protein CROQUDRAFT_663990 [Cronartium quercuum f. sp. fusiforme G11]
MAENLTALEDLAPVISVSSRDRPDAKTQRYDRQLRLWASSGQASLERASIFIGPATATSAQILKNLVLPGVGSFTLFDSQSVTEPDLGHNFFLEETSLGKNRAEEVSRLVAELNPDVSPNAISAELVNHLKLGLDQIIFQSASLLIGVGLEENAEAELAEICWAHNLPLILVQTCGFVGSIRVQVKELGLVETHPDSFVDLRLDCPFPALLGFVRSFDFQSMDSHEHTHIPAVVIIIHFLELFKSTHGGKLPHTSAERAELKKMIMAEKRNADEDNFDEAVGMIWKACKPTVVPNSIQALFLESSCATISPASTPFWILVRTLREFVQTHDHLPLTGALPDMKADTTSYVTLQTIYRQKAQEDLQAFAVILREFLNLNQSLNPDALSEQAVQTFVKHAGFLKLIRGRSLAQERAGPNGLISLLKAEAGTESSTEPTPACWYTALRAAARFRQLHHRYPGSIATDSMTDKVQLEGLVADFITSLGPTNSFADEGLPKPLTDALGEITRAGGSELPQIAALVGGIVAQESIKLISHQYIPLDGTCIFDGIKSTSSILNL